MHHHPSHTFKDLCLKTLKDSGARLTKARLALIDCMEDSREPLSPKEILQKTQKLLDDQELHPLVFATRMAVMAFVRATCSRSGSVCKDWFDRAGKMLYWLL